MRRGTVSMGMATMEIEDGDYRMLVEGSLQGILIHRGMDVLYANAAYLDMFGYPCLEALRLATLRAVLPPEALPEAENVWRALEGGATPPPVRAVINLRSDGRPIHVDVLARRVLWQGRPAVQATVVDVTDQVRLTEAKAAVESANDTLRRSMARLVSDGGIEDFLTAVMLESAELTGALSNGIFVYDDAQDLFRLVGYVTGGKQVDIPADPRFGRWRNPVPPSSIGFWPRLIRERRPLLIDTDEPPGEEGLVSPAWHRSMGHRIVGVVPLFVGDHVLGFMGPCFTKQSAVTEARLVQCTPLAQQAALALQLTRLATRAQERAVAAAIAREREAAAVERLAQAEQANAALRRVNATLAVGGELPDLLASILEEACTHVGAAGAAAFVLDRGGKGLRVAGAHVMGRFVDTIPGYPYGGDRLMPVGEPDALEVLGRRQRPLWVPLCGDTGGLLAPGTVEWHRAQGHKAVVLAAMPLGDRTAGLLGLTFATDVEPPAEALELVNALSQQATLALEMSRLAETASLAAVMDERNRLAREIHDTLAQGFTAILMHLRLIAREKHRLTARAVATLETLEFLAQENLVAARRSVRALRPQVLEEHGFCGALRSLAEAVERTGGPPVIMRIEAGVQFPAAIEAEVFRIVQEALNNAARHAGARRIEVKLAKAQDGRGTVAVQDDGAGFLPAEEGNGFGIRGMRERAARCGAQLDIRSAPDTGTIVRVCWPAMTSCRPLDVADRPTRAIVPEIAAALGD